MNTTIREIMNPSVVYLREGVRPETARHHILAFGITAVPVVNDQRKPVGVLSLRDLVEPPPTGGSPITEPPQTISVDATVEEAARKMVDAGVHHLAVVDADGCIAGMLSTLDVICAYLGVKPKHPAAIDGFGKPRPADAVPQGRGR